MKAQAKAAGLEFDDYKYLEKTNAFCEKKANYPKMCAAGQQALIDSVFEAPAKTSENESK